MGRNHALKSITFFALCLLALTSVAACTSIPSLVLFGDSGDAPAGPKVAALVANLKCELWDAANSQTVLPYYRNIPLLPIRNKADVSADRAFTLHNIFEEIEYVGEASFTLDVTGNTGFNPSVTLSEYLSKAMGVFPATGAILSVGGQLSEAAHRYVVIDSSIDFSRLVASPPNSSWKPSPPETKLAWEPEGACNSGSELAGRLGLKETLALAMIAAAMNDLTVFPTDTPSSGSGGFKISGVSPPVAVPSYYSFGQISAQIDFTVVENANAGPTWTLRYFKGPGGSSSGLFNAGRQVKDTLALTFIPVCIRSKYYTASKTTPFEYKPKMVEGTPAWSNYLPPCYGPAYMQDKVDAVSKAKINNNQILLQNSLRP